MVVILAAFAIAAIACGSDSEPAAEPTATPQPTATTPPPTATPTEAPHDHSSHEHGPVESEGISVDLEVTVDEMSGANVRIIPTGFEFAPESVNMDHVDGEGHAHIYVDGVKIGRVYSPWYHLGGLEPGEHEIVVTLNANTHADYTSGGAPVIASQTITIPEPGEGHMHGHSHMDGGTEAPLGMSVDVRAEADAASGANVFITYSGFTVTPENVNGDHVPGEGHMHVYVGGEKIGRVYGDAIHLGKLPEGEHEIRVTLNANDHSDYMIDGKVVEATTTVHVTKGGDSADKQEGSGDAMDHGHSHG